MSADDEVREASKRFYEGLNRMLNGDASVLAQVWSHGENVTAMHPIGGRHGGWDAVRESFEGVARLASGGTVELRDPILRVVGDAACESGVERGQATLAGRPVAIDHRVTNVYLREAGAWKIAHHHTDISPEMVDVIRRLEERPLKAVKNR